MAAPPEPPRRVFVVLDDGLGGGMLSTAVDAFLVTLILVNVAAVVLETVPDIRERHDELLTTIELFSVAVFTVEYLVRLWVAPEHPLYRQHGPAGGRMRYSVSLGAMIDLVAIAPFYLAFFITGDLRILRLFRLVRFLKLARYSAGLRPLMHALQREWRALVATTVVIACLILTAATFLYYTEHLAQPEDFGSIPAAMWWAVATLTTVGYGDVVPVTALGKFMGGVVMLFGLAMLALPIGIMATAFGQEIHRREFVVNWAMVAKVPLFAELDAEAISEVMTLLDAQTVPPGHVVARGGERAGSMYFIVTGSVETEFEGEKFKFGTGDFFGEGALYREARRLVTFTALEKTSLMVLGHNELETLMLRRPDIAGTPRSA